MESKEIDEKQTNLFPKVIYFLWIQGLDNAPPIIKKCYETWKIQNPGWEIVIIDHTNINKYMDLSYLDNPNMSVQAFSDIVRLRLLSTHGGVWADATCCCMRPIDTYINDIKSDFWMYHGRDRGRGPCSWFMMAKKDSLIAKIWREHTDDFWKKYPKEYEYAWMDRIFANLCLTDKNFLDEWIKVAPWMWCEDRYSAHHFCNNGFYVRLDYSPDDIQGVVDSCPCVVKLNKSININLNNSVSALLSFASIRREEYPKLKFGSLPDMKNANFFNM